MTTTPTTLDPVLDRLGVYVQGRHPVVSLYLDLSPDQHGRDNYRTFVTRAFADELETYPVSSAERASLEASFERIQAYLQGEIDPASHSLAIFACDGEPELFETLQLPVPVDGHRLYVNRRPHLFPLARLAGQHGTCAAVLVNTNRARVWVFAVGAIHRAEQISSEKTKRTSAGGWSQARFQRHADEMHLRHMKEAADAVTRIVDEEHVPHVLLAGDGVALSMLREQLPQRVLDRVIESVNLDIRAPEHAVMKEAFEALRRHDQETDRVDVESALNAYRAGGLATIGLARVRAALELGQVDRLLVPAAPFAEPSARTSADVGASTPKEQVSRLPESTVEALVAAARRTDAGVTFIEDASLLAAAGGVAALLRFRL
ncbi:MAG TPA: Vms1/Ankzf1 family peptidyl-tRNA hydrolase [Vicinamibacterales bacterium]